MKGCLHSSKVEQISLQLDDFLDEKNVPKKNRESGFTLYKTSFNLTTVLTKKK